MRKEDPPGLNRPAHSRKAIRLRPRPLFDPDCFKRAGFPPEDLPPLNWPALWELWLSEARLEIIPLPCKKLLLAALPVRAEEETDRQFRASPFLGYAHDFLARTLCLDLFRVVLGTTLSCLPFPRLSAQEQAVLVRLGLLAPRRPCPILRRRYALLTLLPPAQGCSACALAAACPSAFQA